MSAFALDYWRFRARIAAAVDFRPLTPDEAARWSADPAVGEDYYHVQWIARPDGRFAGETWLIGDQPWADAPEFMIWGLTRRGLFGGETRFAWMFDDWPSAWSRHPAATACT